MKARRFLAFVLLVVFSCGTVRAGDGMKPSKAETKEALQTVIAGQLAAFRAEDYAAAYVFADEELRARIPVDFFERMVKVGYPIIAHSVSATYGLALDNGDEATVNVRVTGASETVTYQYMLRKDGGTWRITGVAALREQATEV